MSQGQSLYAGQDPGDALALLEAGEHGHLTLQARDDTLPDTVFMHYCYESGRGEILGHLARGNPVLERLQADPRAVFTVYGPAAYVPSYWVDRPYGVPTSYYSWAQFRVEASLVTEPEQMMEILRVMLERFQPEGQHPDMDLADSGWSKLLGAITGVRLTIREARSRHKYGQNRTREQRQTVVKRLRERGGEQDLAAAERVLERLAQGRGGNRAQPGEAAP